MYPLSVILTQLSAVPQYAEIGLRLVGTWEHAVVEI